MIFSRTRKAGRHETAPAAPSAQRPESGLFATEDNPHVGPVAPQRRAWRKRAGTWPAVSVPTAPYVEIHAPHTPRPEPATGPDPIPDPRPYVPEPPVTTPLDDPSFHVDQPATLARSDQQFAAVFSVHCGRQGCTRSTSRCGTGTFTSLYAAAAEDGWRKDWFGAWMCPSCQQKPGYWPASVLAPVDDLAELTLVWGASQAAGPDVQWREACRAAAAHPRYPVNVSGVAA